MTFSRSISAAQPDFSQYVLDYGTPTYSTLQARLTEIDTKLRAKYGMTTGQTAVGVLDLNTCRLAMIHPDRIEYAASVAKIRILLAYFQLHPQAADHLDPAVEHELGEMIKCSSNEMASKYSHLLGLKQIQQVLNDYHFYDKNTAAGSGWESTTAGMASATATPSPTIRTPLDLAPVVDDLLSRQN